MISFYIKSFFLEQFVQEIETFFLLITGHWLLFAGVYSLRRSHTILEAPLLGHGHGAVQQYRLSDEVASVMKRTKY